MHNRLKSSGSKRRKQTVREKVKIVKMFIIYIYIRGLYIIYSSNIRNTIVYIVTYS